MFDKDGNLANWWDETSLAEFVKRERCLVNQYQQYSVQGHHVSHVMCIAVVHQCGTIYTKGVAEPRDTVVLYIWTARVIQCIKIKPTIPSDINPNKEMGDHARYRSVWVRILARSKYFYIKVTYLNVFLHSSSWTVKRL